MTKEELKNIFEILNIPANEGILYLNKNGEFPRVVFFEYAWKDLTASDEVYDTLVTYQVSFRSLIPRDSKLIQLKKELANLGLYPDIYIEYIEDKKEWHSYFSIDILENINE